MADGEGSTLIGGGTLMSASLADTGATVGLRRVPMADAQTQTGNSIARHEEKHIGATQSEDLHHHHTEAW